MSTPNKHPLQRRIFLGLGAAAIIGTLGFAGTAMARPGGHFPGMGLMRLLSRMDLTEQQEVKAVRLRRAMADEAEQSRKEVHQLVATAIPELEKAQPDARKLHGLVDQISEKMSKVAHSAIDKYLELHATFTPEQRQTLVESAKTFHERAERRMNDDDFGPGSGQGKRGRRFE